MGLRNDGMKVAEFKQGLDEKFRAIPYPASTNPEKFT